MIDRLKTSLSSPRFRNGLGIAVSAALVLWLAVSFEWGQVVSALSQANYWWLGPAAAAFVFHMFLRALRWRYLLPETSTAPGARVLFDSLMLGNLATYILPLRAGEFIRPYLLSRQTAYSFPTAFISVVTERFFDLAVVLAMFGWMVGQLPAVPEAAHQGAAALGVLASVLFVAIVASALAPRAISRLAHRTLGVLPEKASKPLLKFTDDFITGLRVVADPVRLAIIIAYSLAVWASCFFLFYLILLAFPVGATLMMSIAVTAIIALAVAAPSSPGFIGVFQVGCVAALALFGVAAETGLAVALVAHALHYLLICGYGVFLLGRYNLRINDLRRATAESAAPSGA